MRRVSLLALFFVATSAVAQDGEPVEQGLEPGEPLSELDALSRNADDPFASVVETAQREPVSVTLRALDKITARFTDIEIEMHQIAEFGSLQIQPRFCDKRPPEEFPETTAFLEVFDTEFGAREADLKIDPALLDDGSEETVLPAPSIEDTAPVLAEFPEFGETPEEDAAPLEAAVLPAEPPPATPAPEVLEGPQADGENIFRGWMFASSPALNALEHPVYDVWVIDCKTRAVES
ncbi:MAG: DUF2155 domain-containing protein [Pseudomonadota bacterium]